MQTYITTMEELHSKLLADTSALSNGQQVLKDTLLFRGVSHHHFTLTPSIFRYPAQDPDSEVKSLKEFKAEAILTRPHFSGDTHLWRIMVLAQHYGLPTRLLDWTESPYVALHFATCDRDSFLVPSAIWTLSTAALKLRFKHHILSHLTPFCEIGSLENEGLDPYGLDESLKRKNAGPIVTCLRPPIVDDRIVSQASVFSICFNSTDSLESIVRQQGDTDHPLVHKFIILPELKWEIRRLLNRANLTERFFFPGLEGVAKALTWKHASQFPRVIRHKGDTSQTPPTPARRVIDFSYAPLSPLMNGWSLFGVFRPPTFSEIAMSPGDDPEVQRIGCRIRPEEVHGNEMTYALDYEFPAPYAKITSIEVDWNPERDSGVFYVGIKVNSDTDSVGDPVRFAAVYEGVNVWLKIDSNDVSLAEGVPEKWDTADSEYRIRPNVRLWKNGAGQTMTLNVRDTLAAIDDPHLNGFRDVSAARLRVRGGCDLLEIRIIE